MAQIKRHRSVGRFCSIDDVPVFVSPKSSTQLGLGNKHFNVCSITAMKRAPKTQPPAINSFLAPDHDMTTVDSLVFSIHYFIPTKL
jgi:hypothetical protein